MSARVVVESGGDRWTVVEYFDPPIPPFIHGTFPTKKEAEDEMIELECAECRKRPGAQVLCAGCIARRMLHGEAKEISAALDDAAGVFARFDGSVVGSLFAGEPEKIARLSRAIRRVLLIIDPPAGPIRIGYDVPPEKISPPSIAIGMSIGPVIDLYPTPKKKVPNVPPIVRQFTPEPTGGACTKCYSTSMARRGGCAECLACGYKEPCGA